MISVVLSPLGIPVRPVTANAPAMRVSPDGLGLPIRISDLGAPFVVAGLVPTLTVTGGTITPFNRDGVDYVEVLFTASGSFTLSADATASLALGAGGGGGGARFESAGGSAGQVDVLTGHTLPAGAYTVTIGAGGTPAVNTSGNDGSSSSISGPFSRAVVGGLGGAGANAPGNNGLLGSGAGGGPQGGNPVPFATGGGVGTRHNGGNGWRTDANAQNRAGGGGAGNSAPGADAAAGFGGAGGAGVLLPFIASPRGVGGGGGGGSKVSLAQVGQGIDGGTSGSFGETSPANAVLSGAGGGIGSGTTVLGSAGGNGFLFAVFRADQVAL